MSSTGTYLKGLEVGVVLLALTGGVPGFTSMPPPNSFMSISHTCAVRERQQQAVEMPCRTRRSRTPQHFGSLNHILRQGPRPRGAAPLALLEGCIKPWTLWLTRPRYVWLPGGCRPRLGAGAWGGVGGSD